MDADETPLGLVPKEGDLNTEGLDMDPAAVAEVLKADEDGLRAQLPQVKEHLERLGDSLPPEIGSQFEALEHRLAQ